MGREAVRARQRSWWGWGFTDAQLDDRGTAELGELLAQRFDCPAPAPSPVPDPGALPTSAPRLRPPAALAAIVSDDPVDRIRHGHGSAFRDVARLLRGELGAVPDLVVRPAEPADVRAVLDWCASEGVACVPFGGGTSVVGGVTAPDESTVTLDLSTMRRVLEVDGVSRAARIQAGALGPDIEEQLRPHGLTLRHFPQSWECSTLGGWLATRAGGHYATLLTHVDDLTESITAETPAGTWSSQRVPASGAGPSPDRLLLGSEGALGVITEAWMRVQRRPVFRAQASVSFPSFADGLAAVQALAQSGLYPASCRLLDPVEAALAGAGPPETDRSVLVLGFESDDHPLDPWLERALELSRDHHGRLDDGPHHRAGDVTATASGGAGAWRETFLRAPYLRDALVRLGMVVETFETAMTWDRLPAAAMVVRDAAAEAARAVAGDASASLRVTHAYPDGAAPYVTVVAPAPAGAHPVAVWDEIKVAASEAILAVGATITHHHGVGRDHRPWYDRQRPEPFARALEAAKRALDPAGILNPGVLVG